MDLFFRIACLIEHWPPSTVAICTLLILAPLARFCEICSTYHCFRLPLRFTGGLFGILVLRSHGKHKWSLRPRKSKFNTRSVLIQSVLQAFTFQPVKITHSYSPNSTLGLFCHIWSTERFYFHPTPRLLKPTFLAFRQTLLCSYRS